jgi:hypothetical protein
VPACLLTSKRLTPQHQTAQVVNNIIALKGAVPGHANSYIYVRDAVRLHHWQHNQKLAVPPPVPTHADDLEHRDHEQAPEGVSVAPPELFKNPFEIPE